MSHSPITQENSPEGAPPSNSKGRSFPPARTLARWLLVAAALLVIGRLLWNARSALTPFIVGLVLAYLFLPLVNLLNRRIPRALAILIVYIIAIALIIGVIAYLVPVIVAQVQQLTASLPSVGQLQAMVGNLLQQYQRRVPPSIRQPIDETVNNALRTMQANLTTYVQDASVFIWSQVIQVINVVSFLVGFFIVPIWLFYVLHDQARLRTFINGLLHSRIRADFWNAWDIINHDLGDYVRGQLTLSLIIGSLVTTGMLILQLIGLHMPYALLLGMISTLTELIPVIGPALGMIPGVLIGLLISPLTGLAAFLVYLIIQQFENSFLVPRIIGGSIGIHPAILMMIIIAMWYTFGLMGIILAAPLAAIARDVFIYTYRRLDGRPSEDARQGLIPVHKVPQRKS
jgi:predicted PurR-regulated permease PerM